MSVYDLRHVRTGKLAPIEYETAPAGNVVIDLVAGTYRILGGAELVAARDLGSGRLLRVSHFVNCPNAADWRSRR